MLDDWKKQKQQNEAKAARAAARAEAKETEQAKERVAAAHHRRTVPAVSIPIWTGSNRDSLGRLSSVVNARHADESVVETPGTRAQGQQAEREAQQKLASEMALLAAAGEVDVAGTPAAARAQHHQQQAEPTLSRDISFSAAVDEPIMAPPSKPEMWDIRDVGPMSSSSRTSPARRRSSVTLGGMDQKAIDARWKELNCKVREHEGEVSRVAAKSDGLERQSLQLAKRERKVNKAEAEVQEVLASAQQRQQQSAATAEAAQQAMARVNAQKLECEHKTADINEREAAAEQEEAAIADAHVRLAEAQAEQNEDADVLRAREVALEARAVAVAETKAAAEEQRRELSGREDSLREREIRATLEREEMDRVMKEMAAKDWQQEQRTTELAATEKINAAAAAGFAEREAAVSKREAALATTQEQISALEAEAIERMRHCAELEAKALKEEGEATRLCDEQRTRKQELDSLAQQLNQATQTLADREAEAANIRHEANQRMVLAEGAMKDVASREKSLRADRQQVVESAQQVDSQLAEVASQKARLEAQGHEVAQGQVGLEEMEQDLVQTEADLEARNTELSEKEEKFVVEKAEVDSLKVELEHYAEEVGEREAAIETDKQAVGVERERQGAFEAEWGARKAELERGERRLKARHGELSVFEQSTVLELQQAERWGALEEDYFWELDEQKVSAEQAMKEEMLRARQQAKEMQARKADEEAREQELAAQQLREMVELEALQVQQHAQQQAEAVAMQAEAEAQVQQRFSTEREQEEVVAAAEESAVQHGKYRRNSHHNLSCRDVSERWPVVAEELTAEDSCDAALMKQLQSPAGGLGGLLAAAPRTVSASPADQSFGAPSPAGITGSAGASPGGLQLGGMLGGFLKKKENTRSPHLGGAVINERAAAVTTQPPHTTARFQRESLTDCS